MSEQFLTPVGRLVQGDCFVAQTKDQQGNPLVVKTGANAGQPTQRYFIAVAFAKNDPQFPAFYAMLDRVARASFPALFPVPGQPCTHPKFSMKVVDGDGIDDNGKPNAQKEGFAGHWVVKFASSFAPKCFRAGHYAPHEQLQGPNDIPRGYFVRVAGSVEGNNNAQRPGLYVNLNMIELAGIGDVITSGPDASAVFGASAPALPPGARPTPAAMPGAPAPLAQSVPAMPSAPAYPSVPAAASPMPAVSAAPSIPVHPSPAFVQVPPVAVPAAPAPTAVPQAPAGPAMTAAAQFTYQQYIAAGWTDQQLVAGGLMLASAA